MLKWYKCFFILLLSAVIIFMPGCGHEKQLVSIAVQPTSETFLIPDPSQQVQFTAIGTYIHPPKTQDITNQVTWKTNTPQLITVTSTGLVSPTGQGCGSAILTASLDHGTGPNNNLVMGSATVTVNDPNNTVCP